jgi:hypothetical protein
LRPWRGTEGIDTWQELKSQPDGRITTPIEPLEQLPRDVDRHVVALALLLLSTVRRAGLMVVLRPTEWTPLADVFGDLEEAWAEVKMSCALDI